MKVKLASCGNSDHFQDPDQLLFGCENSHYVTVKTVEEASSVCKKFIERNYLGGGNWIGGQVYENNKCIAQISITGKIMSPKPEHDCNKGNRTMSNNELIAVGTGDVPAWLADEGLELAKAYLEEKSLNPFTCFKAMLKGKNTQLENYWYKAEKAANRVLLSNSLYENSMIILSYTEAEK